ncbi:leucine--tRNA ligase [Hamiltosporidium magnivora]|uniref:leucine--tRNA ligase n=1 Tax=Hamiltosporidium magnivora TaxID=148818 RepID=A0A4Q9L3P3_9MICR|nr:leucine--tRNA ligase [Hamiltosporidium magnivora]
MENKRLNYISSLEQHVDTYVEPNNAEKYFVTFPYPYMNGKLHLGHLFTLSKAEFMARYQQLKGKNVLFPFAFHCTGMPISASADRLKEELKESEIFKDSKNIKVSEKLEEIKKESGSSVSKILTDMGISFSELKNFCDPIYWTKVFPILATKTLKSFHTLIDWRRSFITTNINPYYDSFVKFQFRKLKEANLISFGKRYSIFCPLTNQACLDHDRMKGEGILPIAIDLIKITILSEGDFLGKKLYGRIVFNNRPRKIIINSNDYFVVSKDFIFCKNIYENLKYQGFKESVVEIKGSLLMGLKCKILENEFVITEGKVNGCIVKGSSEQRKISLENESKNANGKIDCCIIKECEDRLFLLENERKEISEISDNKTEISLNFTENLLRFNEPESEVISRSNVRCVVSLLDQYFIDYGNMDLKNKTKKCIEKMIFTKETKEMLIGGLDWINKWGCSRTFGLGTFIPWDNRYLIDSLSDSTIYMIFYTFKHFLFTDLEGKEEIFPVKFLNDSIWNFIIYNGSLEDILKNNSAEIKNYISILSECKKSFEYFYPLDLRVSGKDLIKNHLIFFLMNHCALFPEKYWPKRIFTNGHLMLNSEKMSKSTGNFLTVDDCISKYGVSASRMCLAICGDFNEDANFVESNANAFILKIFNFIVQIENLKDKISYFLSNCKNKNLEEIKDFEEKKLEEIKENKNKNSEEITERFVKISINANKENPDNGDIEYLNSAQFIKSILSTLSVSSLTYQEKFLLQSLNNFINSVDSNYSDMAYRDVVKYGFYEILNLKETFISLGGNSDSDLIILSYLCILLLIYPLIPSLSISLLSKFFKINRFSFPSIIFENKLSQKDEIKNISGIIQDKDSIIGIEYLKKIIKNIKFKASKVNKKNKKIKTVRLSIFNENSLEFWRNEIYAVRNKEDICLFLSKNDKNDIKHNLWADECFKWIEVNEIFVVKEFSKYIENKCGYSVRIVLGDKGIPYEPFIEFEFL